MKPCVPLSQARPLWLRSARWELLLFGVFALLLLGLGIGLRDPWPSDEPRFALVAQLMAEGVAVRRLAVDTAVASLRPYGSPAPGAPTTLPAGTFLVSAAQPLKHWIEALLGQSPEAGGPSTSDVNAWSRPLLMGLPGGTLGAPPPPAPAPAA